MTTFTDSQRARQPKGSPSGGQFASTDRAEATDLELGSPFGDTTPVRVPAVSFTGFDWVSSAGEKMRGVRATCECGVQFEYGLADGSAQMEAAAHTRAHERELGM